MLQISTTVLYTTMSQHNLVSVQNHTEDMVAVSPFSANVYITHHETFSFKCCNICTSCVNNLWSYFQLCP